LCFTFSISGEDRLKIGLITGEFPPMEGGVGAFTQALAQALAAADHQIHIITDRRARPAARRLVDLRQPVELGFALLHPHIHRWRWPALATIADLVERYALDVVNIQYQAAAYNMRSPAINALPWRLKGLTRTAVTFHDLRVPYLFPKAGHLRQAAVSFMARQAHGVIVTNPPDYQTLAATLQSPICQIPIGSNIHAYTPNHIEIAEIREQFGLTPGHCLLGYFGFLNESKGADTLIRALSGLDERVHLVFIGGQTGASDATNEAFLDQLRGLIAELGLTQRVHWTGFVPAARVSAHLHAADVMVMPYRDGVSLRRGTLMATVAHGRPLITTAPTTSTPELVHGQNVWFVPAGDAPALIAAIQTVSADPALRARLGAGAVQVAGLFTWDKIAAQTAAFFATLLDNPDK
jgi:glycosyltransferase involved in cell wall biosynthesis